MNKKEPGGLERDWRKDTHPPPIQLSDILFILSSLPFTAVLLLTISIVRWTTSRKLQPKGKTRQGEETRPIRRRASLHGGPKLPEMRAKPVPEQVVIPQTSWHAIREHFSGLIHELMAMLVTGERLNSILELRNRHYLALDLLVLSLTPTMALTLRDEGLSWWPEALPALCLYTSLAIALRIFFFYLLGLYGRYWPYANISDVSRLIVAVGQSTLLITYFSFLLHPVLFEKNLALPRSVPLIDGMLTVLIAGGIRFSLRGLYDWYHRSRSRTRGTNVLIVGAGEAGMMAVREIRSNPALHLEPVAFIDDDLAKVGAHVNGLPVLGTSHDIPRIVKVYQIQRIFVAIPSAPLPRQLELVELCQKTGVLTETLPGVYQILAGYKTINPLPQFDIQQILHREPIIVDIAGLEPILRGSKIMVTGAGGSIGGELCRQIAQHRPAELILLGHGENSIFEINLDLTLRHPGLVTRQVIADVRDSERIHWAVKTYQPAIIFHTAAHKHVPFMEDSIAEAVMNNVLGTRNILRAAKTYNVARFVLISSDKAINPTNVMGATKRICELLTISAARETKRPYTAVRFGNVLGSRGSVVPLFQRQIAVGGPITVTHPDMCRYFMTIPEAVQLVLQSSVLSNGGEIFVLDMGNPVQIVDLAYDLVRMSGLVVGRDIEIVFSGIRPGEKLREELFLSSESFRRSAHSDIFVAVDHTTIDAEALDTAIDKLILLASETQIPALYQQIQHILPEYHAYPEDATSPETTMPVVKAISWPSPSFG